jgi:hydroxymethylbilane synthase
MIIGTRGSRLAVAQTYLFARTLTSCAKTTLEIRRMKTSGDIDQITDLKNMGGYGAFVRELDDALMTEEIDVSVNSMKDVPVARNNKIEIGAVLERASCEDVILPMRLDELPIGAVIGSSSVRRAAVIRSVRPDIEIRGLRGNIDTRLNKLDSGGYDAIILAKAGLERLEIKREMHTLSIDEFVPSPGQGAIAVACRAKDEEVIDILETVDDADARLETETERTIMKIMGGICSSPIGINAKKENNRLRVRAMYLNGTEIYRSDSNIPVKHTFADLKRIADELKGIGK